LESFSPIVTINSSVKGGGEGIEEKVSDYLIGSNTFAIPSFVFSKGGKKPEEHNSFTNVSEIDDDLHDKLLELAKEDTNIRSTTKKRRKELRHLVTRKKHLKHSNNKTKRMKG
jgi:hypothetical protein